MITIVNYGMGNLGSIKNMLKKIGVESQITADPAQVLAASKLTLPGVGAFDAGMRSLNESGMVPALHEQVLRRRTPVLGICLGMQLMTTRSDEGALAGLGWIDADTVRFPDSPDNTLKVPHMGWNRVTPAKASALLEGVHADARFYFVHSYLVRCRERADVLMTTEHGVQFDAGFERDNVMGVQFHPEKSHRFGMWLLKNFVERVAPC